MNARFVKRDKLSGTVLKVPTEIDNVANFQLRRAHSVVSRAWNDDNLENMAIKKRSITTLKSKPYLISIDWKTVNGSTELKNFFRS